MKVTVERQGGFGGVRRRGEIDGAHLSEEQRAALRQLPATSPAADPGADRFIYKVEIEDEAGTKVLRIPESRIPPVLAKIATG
jgi:hypothetical protein